MIHSISTILSKKHAQAVYKNSNSSYKKGKNLKKSPFIVLVAVLALTLLYAFSIPKTDNSTEKLADLKSRSFAIPTKPLINLMATDLVTEATKWKLVTVKKGQTLSSIFKQLNFSQSLLYKIIHTDENAKKLTKIYPGAIIGFATDEQGKFAQLKFKISETQQLLVSQKHDTLSTKIIEQPTEIEILSASGTITGSLFNAGKKAGLSDAMVMDLANIFAWDIDFVLDIRAGDSFSLIYEKIYQNGDFLRNGKILAASFTNQGETYKAVAFDDGNGISYYTPEGRNMKKAFLRAPLNFSYISSNFNPKRFHPVQKRIKPHRGIDYAAPVGTPVYAAGDGKVTRSSYSKYNGNHIFIKHPSGIVTKYLHLSKRLVKKGQRVKQGKTIGKVGATGMVTGAHLHYEFVLNGVHRNPRTVKLPKASPLQKNKMPAFKSFSAPILSQLDSINKSVQNIALSQQEKQKKS